jgi:hypothetical protein
MMSAMRENIPMFLSCYSSKPAHRVCALRRVPNQRASSIIAAIHRALLIDRTAISPHCQYRLNSTVPNTETVPESVPLCFYELFCALHALKDT